MTLAELQALERDYLMPTYARQPVEFVRGEGTRLWDAEGNEYLDFLTGISVSQIGHCHPALVEAISEQAARLIHVGNLFYTEPAMRLARRLSERSLGGKVFFTNSGAEAIEGAIRLARRATGKSEFLALESSFHGRTHGAPASQQAARALPSHMHRARGRSHHRRNSRHLSLDEQLLMAPIKPSERWRSLTPWQRKLPASQRAFTRRVRWVAITAGRSSKKAPIVLLLSSCVLACARTRSRWSMPTKSGMSSTRSPAKSRSRA